jgi:hypothetical protein
VIRVRIRGVKYRTKYRNPVNQLTLPDPTTATLLSMSCRTSWCTRWNYVAFRRSALNIDIEAFGGEIIASCRMVIVGLRRCAEIVGVLVRRRRFLAKT